MEMPEWTEDIKESMNKFTSKLKLGTILSRGWVRKTILGIGVVLTLGYPTMFISQYEINDNPHLQINPQFVIDGGSKVVSQVVTLLDREINNTIWAPNKPFFYPISWGDDMQMYQEGIAYAVSRWAVEMNDYLGRGRSSTASDGDLEKASGALKYDPRTWVYDIGDSILPRTSSEGMYNNAITALMNYNKRLAEGNAVYDLRADNIINFIDRVRKDLGGQGASLELSILSKDNLTQDELNSLTPEMRELVHSNGGHFDYAADNLFFSTKGRMYGYYIILQALGEDAKKELEARNAYTLWLRMLTSLRSGAELYNLSISNGETMSWIVPNHLAQIGFYLQRADKQLLELENVLSK